MKLNVWLPETTVTVTDLVVVPPAPVAVSVYVLVDPGVTFVLLLLHDTAPTPWSMEQLVALVIPVHESVTESIDCTVLALDVNVPIVGAAADTVNVCAPLVPADVVTVTLRAVVAAALSMVNVAVIDVLLATVTPLTVTPEPLTATVAPLMKLVPVSVTPTAAPCVPAAGETLVNVGAAAFTVTVAVAVALPPAPVAVSV